MSHIINFEGKEYKWEFNEGALEDFIYKHSIEFDCNGERKTLNIKIKNYHGLFWDYKNYHGLMIYNPENITFFMEKLDHLEKKTINFDPLPDNFEQAAKQSLFKAFEFIEEIKNRENKIDFNNIYLNISNYIWKTCLHIRFKKYEICVYSTGLEFETAKFSKTKMIVPSKIKNYKIYDENLNIVIEENNVDEKDVEEKIKNHLKKLLS